MGPRDGEQHADPAEGGRWPGSESSADELRSIVLEDEQQAALGDDEDTAVVRIRPAELAQSITFALVPTTIFCLLVFGFSPTTSQYINQLECDRLQSGDCDSEVVNKAAVRTAQNFAIIQYSCATLVMGTFSGASDYIGRKPPMALAVAGQVVQVGLSLLAVLVRAYTPAITLIYLGGVVNGLTGSYGTYLMAMYAYGADVTRDCPSTRGREFAKITGSVAAGNTLGPLIMGLLLRRLGFAAPYITQLVLGSLCLLSLAWTRESLDPYDRPPEPFAPFSRHNTLAILWRFLGPNRERLIHHEPHPEAHKAVSIGGRRGRRPPPLYPLAATFCLCFSDLVGQGILFLYYAKRAFRWTADVLGYYESCVGGSKALVLFVLLPLVYRFVLKGPPNDFAFAMFGMACNMVFFTVLALVPYGVVAFAVIPLTGLAQITYPHLRSLFSLAVPPDIQGQLFGLMSALEVFSTALTPYIVTQVYNASPSDFPGLVWLVLVGFLLVASVSLLVAWRGTWAPGGGERGEGPEGFGDSGDPSTRLLSAPPGTSSASSPVV